MSKIVFSTITENIRSFFQREEEYGAKPKVVPEAASEVFERAGSVSAPTRIIDRPLPDQARRPDATPLPFSPDELRAALKRATVPPQQPQPITEPTPLPAAPTADPLQFRMELAEFEDALRSAHNTAAPTNNAIETSGATTSARTIANPTTTPQQASVDMRAQNINAAPTKSFFGEFEQFMMREDLQAEGVLEEDIVRRMREFHEHRKENKEYYLFSKDLETAAGRKLDELKALEHDWFRARAAIDDMERSMVMIEHEIEARGSELKALVTQAKSKSRLERKAPQGQEFRLSDGRKLTSLLDLKMALRGMPDAVLNSHFHEGKNDFAAWTRGTFGDNDVAQSLDSARNREQLILALSKLG